MYVSNAPEITGNMVIREIRMIKWSPIFRNFNVIVIRITSIDEMKNARESFL